MADDTDITTPDPDDDNQDDDIEDVEDVEDVEDDEIDASLADDGEESDDDDEDDDAEDDEAKRQPRPLNEIAAAIGTGGIENVSAAELVIYQRHLRSERERVNNASAARQAAERFRPETEASIAKAIEDLVPALAEDTTRSALLRRQIAEAIEPLANGIGAANDTLNLASVEDHLFSKYVPDTAENRAIFSRAETWEEVTDLLVGAGQRLSSTRIKELEAEVESLKEKGKTDKNRTKATRARGEKGSVRTVKSNSSSGGITRETFMKASRTEQAAMMRSHQEEVMALQ